MTTGARVAVYLRQSLDQTGEGLAVDRQRKACEQFCSARGWTVAATYTDNSASASNGTRREFEAMLVDAASGRFAVIVAWALDRLSRTVKDMERLVELAEVRGVRVATVSGDIDLTTDQGRLVGRILAAVARGEVERKAERQRLAHSQRAEAGRPPTGGWRLVGYSADGMQIVPAEADLIRQGFELVLAGGSIRSVMRLWNDGGLTTARGRPWQPYSVRDALRNPRFAGLSVLRGEVVGVGAWPPIVPRETYQAVRAILDDESRRTRPSGPPRTHLLSGLARCGVCGAVVRAGGQSNRGGRTYRCSSRKHFVRRAEVIEEYVEAVIVARLARPDIAELVAQHDRPDVQGLHAEASTLRTRRDQLAEAFAAGEITRSQLVAGSRRIEARLGELEGQLAAVARTSALSAFVTADDVRAVWDGLDVDRRRAVIAELCSVTIHPSGRGAKRFDPESVTLTPR
jgi:site-specific DNA recombinase